MFEMALSIALGLAMFWSTTGFGTYLIMCIAGKSEFSLLGALFSLIIGPLLIHR